MNIKPIDLPGILFEKPECHLDDNWQVFDSQRLNRLRQLVGRQWVIAMKKDLDDEAGYWEEFKFQIEVELRKRRV